MKDNDKYLLTIQIIPGHDHAAKATSARRHLSQSAKDPLTGQTEPFERAPFHRPLLLHSAIYALLTASSLFLLASCVQLQPPPPQSPKVVSTPQPKPKSVLYQ